MQKFRYIFLSVLLVMSGLLLAACGGEQAADAADNLRGGLNSRADLTFPLGM